MTKALPVGVVKAAAQLKSYPGVVGVFWGFGRTDAGTRHTEKRICVHVRWKRPLAQMPAGELIPDFVGRYKTHVVEVGAVRAHALTHTDDVTGSELVRHGTIAAIARDDTNGALGLMSGHVALPTHGNTIVHRYTSAASPAAFVDAHETGGGLFHGQVERGVFADGGALDFALARFAVATGPLVDTHHVLAGEPPFTARGVALVHGERLRHYSRLQSRAKVIQGRYDQQAVLPMAVTLPDDTQGTYSELIAISKDDTLPFSEEGDSGSLVVDDALRVVGIILGSTADKSMAYALPISPLIHALGSTVGAKFFA